jgi:arylsulfatase A-like enzyme
VLKGGAALQRSAIYWHYPHYHPGSATPYSAIRDGDWKLIHFYEDNHVELYNLRADLGEKNDLARTNVAKATELRAKLDAWRASVGAQAPTQNPDYDPKREWQEAGQAQKAAEAGKA